MTEDRFDHSHLIWQLQPHKLSRWSRTETGRRVDQINRLLMIASPEASPCTADDLRRFLGSSHAHIVVVEDLSLHEYLALAVLIVPPSLGTKRAQLENVAVLESFRNRGLGFRVCKAAILLARQLGVTNLTVMPPDDGAAEFYEQLGWTAQAQATLHLDPRTANTGAHDPRIILAP